MCMNGSTATL